MTIWYEQAGAGEPVVLLHSGVTDSRMWDPQMAALTERFRVIRVDYRGFGRSPYEADAPFSTCGDVADVLSELGVERAALVASSYGCRIALQLASQGLATRLVLLNAGSDLPKTDDMRAFGAEEDRLLELGDLKAAAELNAATWLGPEATAGVHAFVAEMQELAFSLQIGREPDEFEPDTRPLAEIDVPALVVGGAHDLLHFRQSAPRLAAQLPQAKLVELDWAGHLPSLERPDEITRLLLDYL